jgi:hypothetical protein
MRLAAGSDSPKLRRKAKAEDEGFLTSLINRIRAPPIPWEIRGLTLYN